MVDFRLTEKQLALRQLARDFVNDEAKPVVAELDRRSNPEDCVSDVLMKRCSELGFRTLALPESFGGGGVEDTVTIGIVCEELGVADLSLASIPVNGRKLLHILNPDVASEEVRGKWMKEYCADPAFMVAIAMTEPDSGGDNILPYDAEGAGVRTTAVPDGDDYVINGRKQFIAHAGIARLYVVFTRTDPAKGMSEGCTSFLIPAGHPGMSFGRVHDKMGFRLLRNQEIVFENCRVPKEWMLGPLHGGLASMRAGLRSDGILNAARCLGVARRALEEIVDWCKGRVQGGKPVIEHQAIACELADMHVTLQAMRALVWNVAWSVDHEPPDPKAVPGVMVFCTENAFEIAHKAAELAGGMGVMKDMPFEKILRDAFCIKHLDGGNYLKRFKVTAAL
ncbi:MAG: acyl-CoA dehydrogenase family protein [Nitrospinota bacterium]